MSCFEVKEEVSGAPAPYRVFVDGVDKGEVFKRAGRYFWRRGQGPAVEPFARDQNLNDVARWARKVCNGKTAAVRRNGRPNAYGWDKED